MSTSTNWSALWADQKYLALHARKDKLGAAWNLADGNHSPEADRLGRLFDRACKRINAYESAFALVAWEASL